MIDEHKSNDISQSRRKGPFLGEKGPIIWQSRFKVVLLEVAFYVKAESDLAHCPTLLYH